MANERLRDALLTKGITPQQLAETLGVSPKTVERWLTQTRVPYPRHRHQIAALLKERETYLWPNALPDHRADQVNESEIIKVYAHRGMVPVDLWDRLLDQAVEHIEILVYVGMFMTEKHDLIRRLQRKAEDGAQIRILLGEPDSPAVTQRSLDEGIGEHAISAKIGHALAFFRPLFGMDGIEVRTHGTVLYNSIYRFDNEMLVNPHVYGKTAPHAPALHLRRLSAGDLFGTYTDSFEAVWLTGKPVE
ncbi:DUF5919 domain-containing protein [Actinocorallia sp. B10E7]|uniref:DUF5919 domain-containing protein n=1 Tax=Actinocorallia sp. B10E7 TaxID=3153558 RepID=UPI00325C7ED7